MLAEQSVILELEEAVRAGSPAKRLEALRQVTSLFQNDGLRLSDEQIAVFDDVFCLLILNVETRARAQLSRQLSRLDHAPTGIIQHLARDDEISVAAHVLAHSKQVATTTLVDIARSKGQDHLYAIAGRIDLPEIVTDVIVTRGEPRVIRSLASNATARFSETGYAGMVAHAGADDDLTEILGLRPDLPFQFREDLLRRATEAVRERLSENAPPELKDEIGRVLASIAGSVALPAPPKPPQDFARAEASVKRMKSSGELSEPAILTFAETNRFDEIAAALAMTNEVPTPMMAKVLAGTRHDLVLIPCKAAGLSWATVEIILSRRPTTQPLNPKILMTAAQDYRRLSVETAQRTLRFWLLHDKVEK
jgi:uncharacterized protein (DUF2336 family)